jgi:hypothetical protein
MKLTNRLLLVVTFLIFAVSCQEGLQQPLHLYTLNNPADTGSRFPNFYEDNDGMVYMSWLMHIDEDIYALQFAKYDGDGWTDARGVKVGTDFFANWADFPSVVGLNGEAVAAHRLKKIEGGPYAYNVEITFPDTATGRWEHTITPHLDGTATEHGFVSVEPLAEDRVLAIWLDGRNTEGRGHDEYADSDKAMTLRSAEVTRDGEITRKNIIDPMVCDCCQTDLVPVVDGYVAVYRGRTEGEIRDILISRYDLETGEWSSPVAVHDDNWEIQACPVNGPRVAASGNYVAVAWYTRANDEPRVLLARSTDGGQTFQEPITVAEENTAGRADLLLTEEGSIFVSWLQVDGQTGFVMFREVLPDGSLREPMNIGITSSSRSSGFPRIAKSGDSIIFAWTQTEPLVRVRTARVDIRQEEF